MNDERALSVPMKQVSDLLEKMKPQIASALPTHVRPELMVRVVLTSIRRNPNLLKCDQRSLLGAVVQAAQLGLMPDGVLGEAYLVPYKQECQLLVGYKGLLKLARQSGQVLSLSARVVHANDHFKYEFGLNEKLEHVPCGDEDPGPVTHVYAVAKLRDGSHQMEVMTRSEVERIRRASNSAKSGRQSPWDTHPEEMARKTVLRRLAKLLPVSTELQRAVALDERAEAGISQELDDGIVDVEGIEVPPAEEQATQPEGRRLPLGQQKTEGATS